MAIIMKKKGTDIGDSLDTDAPTPKKGAKDSASIVAALKKAHGEQTVLDGGQFIAVGRLPTGIFALDMAIGGGFPFARTSTIWGPESSGKTALSLKLMASCQRAGRTAVLIDAEQVYDPVWTAKYGVNVKELIVVQPSNGEQAVEAAEGFLNAEDVGLVVFDSLATLSAQKMIDSDPGTANVGGNTQLVSKLYTKAGSALTNQKKLKRDTMFVVINQIRHKIGVMFGDPETQPGGFMPKFASSLSLRLYGKKMVEKDIDPHMPAYIHTSGVVKKWRVPIVRTSFEYDMQLIANNGLNVGDVASWNTVAHHLQAFGECLKEGGAYHIFDLEFPTLKLAETYYNEQEKFRLKCQKWVLDQSDKIAPQEPKAKKSK